MAVIHAAFIDAGFVPACSKKIHSPPWIAGALVETPSLRYTVPRQQPNSQGASAAVVQLLVHGDHVVVAYRYHGSDRPESRNWRCMDARATALLLLSGDLDGAARKLDCDALGVWLWEDVLADGICERILDDLLTNHRRPRRARRGTFPHFMSLPDDLIATVLSRLTGGGEHLAVVECTCTKLRRLISECDGELWRTMYVNKARRVSAAVVRGRPGKATATGKVQRANRLAVKLRELRDRTSTSPAASWKAKYMSYVTAARSVIPSGSGLCLTIPSLRFWLRFWFSYRYLEPTWLAHRSWQRRRQLAQPESVRLLTPPRRPPKYCRCRLDARYDRSLLKDALERLLRVRGRLRIGEVIANAESDVPVPVSAANCCRYNYKDVPSVQSGKRRRGKGVIHSSSSRYRWMHR